MNNFELDKNIYIEILKRKVIELQESNLLLNVILCQKDGIIEELENEKEILKKKQEEVVKENIDNE